MSAENGDPPFANFPWEIGYIVDPDLRHTGFAVVRGALFTKDHDTRLKALAADFHLIGITCQGVFPMLGRTSGNVPDDEGLIEGRGAPYLALIEGWAHCFRRPDDYLPLGVPWTLFSNSDNMNPDWVWRAANEAGPLEKRWDFVYSCLPDRSNLARKNWDLAKRCIARFTGELGLRGALIGLEGVDGVPEDPRIDVFPKLPWRECLRVLGQSRFAFFPNSWDPSPRLMAEAMCLDVPVLVNSEILGGWKYVKPATGCFFMGDEDVLESLAALWRHDPHPRDWYCANYGRANAGPRLAEFLRQVAPEDPTILDLESASFFSPRDYRAMPKPRPAPSGEPPFPETALERAAEVG